jgi:hypothetical protein
VQSLIEPKDRDRSFTQSIPSDDFALECIKVIDFFVRWLDEVRDDWLCVINNKVDFTPILLLAGFTV